MIIAVGAAAGKGGRRGLAVNGDNGYIVVITDHENRMPDAKRSWVGSPIVAGIVGVFAGGVVVMLLEAAGHRVFGTADPADLSSVTTPMFASVLVAWVAGAGTAAAVATIWARTASTLPGLIAGLVLLAGSVANLVAFPHPVWMAAGALVLMPLAAFAAARGLASRAR